MSTDTDNTRPVDPGLEALVTTLRLQGVAADAGQIRHQLGTDKIGAPEMLRCAKDLGLKARAYRTHWSRLAKTPLPAIAILRDGGFLVTAKASEDKVLVQSPQAPRPTLMTRAEFIAVWDGRLILMTRRAGLSDIDSAIRHHLVSRSDPQISASSRRGVDRVVLSAAIRPGLAAILSGGHR